jgi:hypothetical protein
MLMARRRKNEKFVGACESQKWLITNGVFNYVVPTKAAYRAFHFRVARYHDMKLTLL